MSSTDPRWALFQNQFPLVIDGDEVLTEHSAEIVSPRDKSVVGSFALAGKSEMDTALRAARSAQPGWAGLPGRERARAITKAAEIMEAHAAEFEFLDAVDIGKPVMSGRYSDIPMALDGLSFFAGRAQDIGGVSVEVGDAAVSHRQIIEPRGVVLEVLPWNGPLWTGVPRVAAILAAGNACIVKPAIVGSASFLHFVRLVAPLFPPGVLQVLTGSGGSVGNALATSPLVDMVSLTGGVETGVRLLRDLAPQLKPVTLELGGKNPNIVLDDADLENAVNWSVMGAFASSGQVCVCGSRILVQRGIYDAFAEALVEGAQKRIVGDPILEATEMGPVVGGDHYDSIWAYLDQAAENGDGELLAGGTRYTDEREGGWYIPPTVLGQVAPSCRIMREEVFGPLVTLTPVDDLDEALQIANDTSYGLASGIFTRSVESADRASRALQAGQVYVNQWFSPGVLQAPSSGYKNSGYGVVGMEKYQQIKNVFVRSN